MTTAPPNPYTVESMRVTAGFNGRTGIYVRAHAYDGTADGWGSWDIATLDRPSLLRWLRAGGGTRSRSENVVLLLLGHDPEEGDE